MLLIQILELNYNGKANMCVYTYLREIFALSMNIRGTHKKTLRCYCESRVKVKVKKNLIHLRSYTSVVI